MKPRLRLDELEIWMSDLTEESCVPDIFGMDNVQNRITFQLDEEDEIYEGYGQLPTAYPYRRRDGYDREGRIRKTAAAVLENEHLKAVFLPELGGRLWSLFDKGKGRNLLYTNDIIRFRNLSVRNGWFSGGVEWNIGVIGHTPLTLEPLFTEELEDGEGNPVLRMYEYERIRKVVYQMDFWLGQEDSFLNCHMRISNQTGRVVPMYWWSNIAVPEYERGRVIAPGKEAITYSGGCVHKVEVPIVNGRDISFYQNIDSSKDYFFQSENTERKFIANVDGEGCGLLQVSTSRLQSRKLFSWGNKEASGRWQEFLTKDAGRYLEIQAGLAKTQYGCLPMAPNTAWEWIEQYGAVSISKEKAGGDYGQAQEEVGRIVKERFPREKGEALLEKRKPFMKKSGRRLLSGSGYGALENCVRAQKNQAPLSPFLDFGAITEKQKEWERLLEENTFPIPPVEKRPEDFTDDEWISRKLCAYIQEAGAANWYANYQMGIIELSRGETEKARKYLQQSREAAPNPWALHGLAVIALGERSREAAGAFIRKGVSWCMEDASYIKEAFRILLTAGDYEELIQVYKELSPAIRENSRIKFGYITALAYTEKTEEAYLLLNEEGMVLEDIREGEDSIGALWSYLHEKRYGVPGNIPRRFRFDALE